MTERQKILIVDDYQRILARYLEKTAGTHWDLIALDEFSPMTAQDYEEHYLCRFTPALKALDGVSQKAHKQQANYHRDRATWKGRMRGRYGS